MTSILLNTADNSNSDGVKVAKNKVVIPIPGMSSEGDLSAASQRAFVPVSPDSYYYKISQYAGTTAEVVTYIDIDEDGRLDIVIQKRANGLPYL